MGLVSWLIINGDDSLANHAYRDKERREIILASEALEENRDKFFIVQIRYVIVNYLYVLLMALGKHILEQLNLRINILLIVLMQIVQSLLMTINLMS